MTTHTVANIIVQQIGNRAFAMMGAKNLLGGDDRLQFKIGKNAKGVTHITVILDASDTYTVKFDKVTKYRMNARTGEMVGGAKTLAELDGVYVDSLKAVIESNTGLYLSL